MNLSVSTVLSYNWSTGHTIFPGWVVEILVFFAVNSMTFDNCKIGFLLSIKFARVSVGSVPDDLTQIMKTVWFFEVLAFR
jgi:hypothetical protein